MTKRKLKKKLKLKLKMEWNSISIRYENHEKKKVTDYDQQNQKTRLKASQKWQKKLLKSHI